MRLIIFSHPFFVKSRSMTLFAEMLICQAKYHNIQAEILSPDSRFYDIVPIVRFKKWAGYLDRFVVFPVKVRAILKTLPVDSVFVFSDQALGPWVSLVRNRPHVIHTHDLLALRSALGEFPQNPVSFTGRIYQKYIKRGFLSGKRFICVSEKTRRDLVEYGAVSDNLCKVIYDGFNFPYAPIKSGDISEVLREVHQDIYFRKYWVHVGGSLWYKNSEGVIEIYREYVSRTPLPSKLLIVTSNLTYKASELIRRYGLEQHVHIVCNVSPHQLQAIYSGSLGLIFPSHAEGFGWPIVEAMACGCPVITTDDAPMNEIGGSLAYYVPKVRADEDHSLWSHLGYGHMVHIERMTESDKIVMAKNLVSWTNQFDQQKIFSKYLDVYRDELSKYQVVVT